MLSSTTSGRRRRGWSRRLMGVAGAGALLLAVTGCGDDDSGSDNARETEETVQEALAANGYITADLDVFIPHQANLRISEFVAGVLELPPEKVFNNIQRYGNTTAASIPIALHEACEAGLVTPGKLLCLGAFGAGFTWAAALIRLRRLQFLVLVRYRIRLVLVLGASRCGRLRADENGLRQMPHDQLDRANAVVVADRTRRVLVDRRAVEADRGLRYAVVPRRAPRELDRHTRRVQLAGHRVRPSTRLEQLVAQGEILLAQCIHVDILAGRWLLGLRGR